MSEPFLVPVSGLLEPFRLGEKAPAGHSRKNVCQRTMLFEALSPLETYPSNKLRETSTNYTLDQFELLDLSLDWPITVGEGQPRDNGTFVLEESLCKTTQFRNLTCLNS